MTPRRRSRRDRRGRTPAFGLAGLGRLAARPGRLTDERIALAAMSRSGRHDVPAPLQREPLAILCTSLREEAALTAAGVDHAVTRLVELVGAWPPGGGFESGLAPIVVTGLPDAPCAHLAAALVAAGVPAPGGTDPLEVALSSWSFEMDWHLPTYAEWLHAADLTAAYAMAATTSLLVGPAHLERLGDIARAAPGAAVVIIGTDPAGAVDRSVEFIAARRERWSSSVDRDKLRRYLAFRLGVMSERAADDPDGLRVVRVPAEAVTEDAGRVAATVVDGGR